MRLEKLLNQIDRYSIIQGDLTTEVTSIVYDSRKVQNGSLFVCISGTVVDGHKYIEKALELGAKTLIVEKDVEVPLDITVIKVKDSRYALAMISKEWFGNPTDSLTTIAITGTKGKTTTSYMIKQMLEDDGQKVGLIGTIGIMIGDVLTPTINTTPESYILQEAFRKMVDDGVKYVVMEVSSLALKMNRVAGIIFDYGIFTNLEEDHLGGNEHKDMEEYVYCKSLLFQNCKKGIINSDADYLDGIVKNHTCEMQSFGLTNKSDLYATDIKQIFTNQDFGIKYKLQGLLDYEVFVDIPATFTVYNSLAAISVCNQIGISKEAILKALNKIKVKGRLEIVPTPYNFMLMIDYAHNAMSLEAILKDMKTYKPNRIVSLFGCGGNRSKVRRYEMGEISSQLADLTVVTSDNPRDEEPMDIINDILIGVHKADGKYVTIPDRKEAIKYCIENGQDGDIIVLAGKGHEDYQEIKGVKYHMDERDLIQEILEELK